MGNLIKIEFYKLRKGRSKYILFLFFITILLLPLMTLKNTNFRENNFYSNSSIFYDVNYKFTLPLFVGIFTLIFTCKEFKNKPIKNLITSKYPRAAIVLAKFFSLFIAITITYIVAVISYTAISYYVSSKGPIYIDDKITSLTDIALNLIQYNIMTICYIATIIAFSLMLGLVFKKQGISILIYIIAIIFLIVLYHHFKNTNMTILNYTFMVLSNINYSNFTGYNYKHLLDIITALSNMFLFLCISTIIFSKYQYL